MTQLYPKCHPYYNIDGKKVKNKRKMGPAYTAKGQMLPCCFCDSSNLKWKKEYEFYGLWDKHLNVNNVNNIMEILTSDEWYEFHKMLVENPAAAPHICKWKCSVKHNEWKFQDA